MTRLLHSVHPHPISLILVAAVAACAGGSNPGNDDDDDDGVSVDAAVSIDAPMSSIDAPMTPVDAGPDAAPLVGDLCSSAETITLTGGVGMTTITATTAAYMGNYDPGACTDTSEDGPDRAYVVNVAAGNRIIATVTPTSDTFDPGIFLIGGPASSCDAATITCLAANDAGLDGDADTAIYRNTGTTAVDVYILVDGYAATGNAFTLDVNVGPIPPPPTGDTCALAESVTLVNNMATVLGTTSTLTGYNNDYAPDDTGNCTGYAEPGNDRVHQVTVPAGQRLTATVTPTSTTFDAAVYFVATPAATCTVSPLVCAGGRDEAFGGDPETAHYSNNTGAPSDVFVIIDSYNAGAGDGYMLGLTVAPPPPGESCMDAEAIDVSSGAATVTGTTVGYTNDHDPTDYPNGSCTNYYTNGPDRLYKLAIPAQRTITVTVTPETAYDAGIYLIAGPPANCAATPATCLAGDDTNAAGEADTITYANTGNAPIDVFLGVDGSGTTSTPEGTYTLAITIAP
jgi:hypothetical protein